MVMANYRPESKGCQFEKKRFSVSMRSEFKKDKICKCGKPAGAYKLNGEYMCKECFTSKDIHGENIKNG
jgi:hypothetical protein